MSRSPSPPIGRLGAIIIDADADEYTRASNLPPTTAVTIACFFYLAADRNTFSGILSLDDGVDLASPNYLYLETAANGTDLEAHLQTGGVEQVTAAILALTVGQWHFIALTHDAATLTGYAGLVSGGALSSAAVASAGVPVVTTLRIGRAPFTGEFCNGRIAGVKIWNRVLTPAELEKERRQLAPYHLSSLNSFYPLANPATATWGASDNSRQLTPGTATHGEGPPVPWLLAPVQKRQIWDVPPAVGGGSASVGAAAALAVAVAIGASVVAAIGSASASSAVTAVGQATASAVSTAAAAGSATAVGKSLAAAVGSASATSQATAVPIVTGAAAGVGSATGVGQSLAAAVGSASAVGSATAVGRATADAVGEASAAGVTTAIGSSIASAIGSASATSAATAIPAGAYTGSAAATGQATAVGASVTSAVGSAAASGAAVGVGGATDAGSASVASTSQVSAVGTSLAVAVGSANGSGSATAVSGGVVSAVGSASATSSLTGSSAQGGVILAAVPMIVTTISEIPMVEPVIGTVSI